MNKTVSVCVECVLFVEGLKPNARANKVIDDMHTEVLAARLPDMT